MVQNKVDLIMLSALIGEAFDELGLDQASWPFVIMKGKCLG